MKKSFDLRASLFHVSPAHALSRGCYRNAGPVDLLMTAMALLVGIPLLRLWWYHLQTILCKGQTTNEDMRGTEAVESSGSLFDCRVVRSLCLSELLCVCCAQHRRITYEKYGHLNEALLVRAVRKCCTLANFWHSHHTALHPHSCPFFFFHPAQTNPKTFARPTLHLRPAPQPCTEITTTATTRAAGRTRSPCCAPPRPAPASRTYRNGCT